MKINRLVLTNYGPYAGENAFDLHTTEDHPIILFGGKNGAGKTTLFNAIQICLHGRSAFDETISRAEYEQRMENLLHASEGQKATRGSVRLEFEYADFGTTERYTVERSFRDRGKSLVEDVTVRRNGSELSDLEEDQWEDFLKELIPPGISQLFFFNGEKVEKLARAIEDDEAFTDSLMSLLGLDLVERLDTDLTIYTSQKLDEDGHDELAEEINNVREELQELEDERTELREGIKSKQERIAELEEQIDRKEQQLAEEGGAFADRRDEYKEERTRLKTEINQIREDIRDLARNCYPFALAPNLCREVVDQLERETETAQKIAARDEALDALDEIAGDEEVWQHIDVPEGESDVVVTQLQAALSNRLSPPRDAEYELAAEFSQREQQQIRSLVDRALNEIPAELGQLTDELEEKTRRLQDVEDKLESAPDENVIQPIVTDLNDLAAEKSELEQQIESREQRLEEIENYHGRRKSTLEKKLEKRKELDDVSERADLASDVQDVVRAYRDRLVDEKLERLEEVLTDRYLRLSNKQEFYDQVLIDTDEIDIQIKTVDGDTKHQSQLSAGERQIFATALLWALADISGRPLPFIIDTPLSRLDTEHRGNLVENFFPNAAHQVFLFSTDTEITDEYREALRDDIAAEFHLQHDPETGQTSITPGYFGVPAASAVQSIDRTSANRDKRIQQQTSIEGFSDD